MPVAKDYLNRIWIGDYFCEHYPLDDMAEKIVEMARKFHPNRVEVEDVGAQGIIKPQVERLQRAEKRLVRGATVGLKNPAGIKKEDRIANTLKTYVNNGRMFVKDWMTDLYEQLWHFPKARNDDLLDGLYYAIFRLRPPKSESFPIAELKLKKDKKKSERPVLYDWKTGFKVQ